MVEENFSTREPQFYKSLFQTNVEVQDGIKYPIFPVPIGNSRETGEIEYDIQAPLVKYHHNASNIYVFSSVLSSFTASGENNSVKTIKTRIKESLNFQYQAYKDRITFENDIIPYQVKNPGDQRLHYNIKKWKKGPI